MRLIRPILDLRSDSHANTRLELHNERVVKTRVPWLSAIHICFSLADWITTGQPLLQAALFRFASIMFGLALWHLTRARVWFTIRILLLLCPYMFVVEYVMLRYNLILSPYFSGMALVMICATMSMPIKAVYAAPIYLINVLPVLVWVGLYGAGDPMSTALTLFMTVGMVIVCVVNSSQVHSDFRKRLEAQEALARDLGSREKEIREKADDLLRRRAFESQFSPQVVSSVLRKGSGSLEMQEKRISVVVIDVIGSSAKTKELDPQSYKEVIEEVFDVFSSACLRWNVTVDKFTGDGAQAFAGAPTTSTDDTARAIMACRDTIQMLAVRNKVLTRRWGEPLQIRSAVCEGPALVGFIGRGTLKSFTAIGETVSFTHRLCAAGLPGRVTFYSVSAHSALDFNAPGFDREIQTISNLKGFGKGEFQVALLTPTNQPDILIDHGRCRHCGTPLVTEKNAHGLPGLTCPGCDARTGSFAA